MKVSKCSLIFTAAATIALAASAVPARRGARVVSQPDGTTLTIHVIGDEFRHFTLTDDNMLLTEDDNGQFSYARINASGEVVSTKIKALDSKVRPTSHANFLQSINDVNIDASAANQKSSAKRRTTAYNSLGKFTTEFPNKGEVKGLVILVQFSDKSFSSSLYTSSGGAKQYFTQMLNAEGFSKNNATGSARDYFLDQSSNQFIPTFDVCGPITLTQKKSYYGSNDSYGDDTHAGQMIMEACQLADDIINFADYDCDGDGYVDNVFVFYAGTGEATSGVASDVWPHQFSLSEAASYGEEGVDVITCDGVRVDKYACSNEIVDGKTDGIGTFVHEFSHVMGLPDLYYTGSGTDHGKTPGEYSVLDYGPYNNNSRTPPAYGAYERNAMGWIDLDEFNGSDTYELENLASSNKAYVVGTSNEKEFFLFENRQQTGWDAYIPNHGMLIWHIDAKKQSYFDGDMPNNDGTHQCVVIVKANNVDSYDDGAYGWTWPGSTNKTSFSSTTTPAFKDWQNVASSCSLLNIAETKGIVTFDVTMPLVAPVPDAEDQIVKGDDYFYASWAESKNATDYKLWAYTAKYATNDDIETEKANMGSGTTISLPTGWTSNGISANTTSGNYGEASPAAKMTASTSYIQTGAYDSNVMGISYWYKGVNLRTGSYLNVMGLINGEWQTIYKHDISAGDTGTMTINDIPDGVKQVKFQANRTTGSISVDDIVITTIPETKYEVLPDYDGVLTSGNTSVRVDKLVDGCNTYAFRVAATEDGKNFTDMSEYRAVNLGVTGVGNIAVDADDEVLIAVSGRTVTVSTAAERVEVYNVMGHHIASVRVSDGQAVVDMPTAGMYVVRAGNVSTKVVVR